MQVSHKVVPVVQRQAHESSSHENKFHLRLINAHTQLDLTFLQLELRWPLCSIAAQPESTHVHQRVMSDANLHRGHTVCHAF